LGNGVVSFAGWKGANGNLIKIRHNATYQSAYAHMKRFAKGSELAGTLREEEELAFVVPVPFTASTEIHQNSLRGVDLVQQTETPWTVHRRVSRFAILTATAVRRQGGTLFHSRVGRFLWYDEGHSTKREGLWKR
jgi:hypothetical protein